MLLLSFPMPAHETSPIRVLFVCLGNICRSPAADNVFRHLVEKAGLSEHFEIDSAGTIDFHRGKGPDQRMIRAAKARGIVMTGQSRPVELEDFSRFHYILAMDRSNLSDLQQIRNQVENPTAKLQLFCEYCENFPHEEVPDPYYGGDEGFEEELNLVTDGAEKFLNTCRQKLSV